MKNVWVSLYSLVTGDQYGMSFNTDVDASEIYNEITKRLKTTEEVADYGYFEVECSKNPDDDDEYKDDEEDEIYES